jgi:cellulose synthase/poly-beta-1,6-N-acetylglucosamine synthase-like glycosyltransferase
MSVDDRLSIPSDRAASPEPAFFDHPPGFRHSHARRIRGRLAACPEIDCLRHRLPPGPLAAAQLRAAEIGIGADQALIAAGAISEADYAQALAQSLGLEFDRLETVTRADCPLNETRILDDARDGYIRLRHPGADVLAVAPHGYGARHLIQFLAARPDAAAHVRITTKAAIERFIRLHLPAAIGRRAAYALAGTQPEFSAATVSASRVVILGAALSVAALFFAPKAVSGTLEMLLALVFLGWIGLRLLGALTTGLLWQRNVTLPEERLPVYSVIVALYRETATLQDLVTSLGALDYPPEKLEIKLVIEPDDWEMRAACARLSLDSRFEVIVAPAFGPRTKPKALNAALTSARGRFIAVYDAEDRPEPDQLRRALQAFLVSDERLACVQARLTIDNASDTTLTRLFTAEYAGLFDVFLPGLAAWQLPLPLGGSSNHFRAEALRHVGEWDPYNVTEDADLGMRLSRFGYRAAMIDSVTYEEAPRRFMPWLRQRTRWFKGWMQTWLVHMRHPLELMGDLGPAGFVVFQLVVGGTVLAALVHSVFVAALIWQLGIAGSFASADNFAETVIAGVHGTTLASGYLISAVLCLIGLARRNLLHCAWSLLLTPIYWVMLSIAAWRALFQLAYAPYHWEKTEHGLASTSRLALDRTRKLHRG